MLHLGQIINRKLSVQISAKVVLAIAILLIAGLYVMLHFSRKAVKEEALQDAEQTLEYTVRQIDNVLLSVEQAGGNIYWDLLLHLQDPDCMQKYCEILVQSNPYIAGCAIAFEPYYFKERGQYFMTYVHRSYTDYLGNDNMPLFYKTSFGNTPYTEQTWYRQPMDSGRACWIDPFKNEEANGVAITSFCLPIYARDGHRVGVMAIDVTLGLLSKIVLAAKTSPRSYAVLLGSDGSYIVHPDNNKVARRTIYMDVEESKDPDMREAAELMMAGETGCRHFPMDGIDCYVFFKPFQRSAVPGRSLEDAGWHIGLIYPAEDIFGEYNHLLYIVILIAVVGLLLLFVGCRAVTHRQLLPLRLLSNSAQRIAEGHYDDRIPDTHQQDEVGSLQHHFQQMQKALSYHVGELERLTARLRKQGDVLTKSYDRVKEADRLKTAFLHNMTDQMIHPVGIIEKDVNVLATQATDAETTKQLVEDIQQQGKVVTELLNHLLEVSQEKGKEKV